MKYMKYYQDNARCKNAVAKGVVVAIVVVIILAAVAGIYIYSTSFAPGPTRTTVVTTVVTSILQTVTQPGTTIVTTVPTVTAVTTVQTVVVTTTPTGPLKLTIVSASTGGGGYLSTSAIISAIGYLEDVVLVHQAGAGTLGISLLAEGKCDIGLGYTGDALELYRKGFKEIRVLFPVGVYPGQLFTRADSDIKSWRDLNGKVISIGSPAFVANKMFKEIMKALNIQPKEVKELGHEDSFNLLVTGAIDAYFLTALPNPTAQEYAMRYPLKVVPPSPEEITIIKEALPQFPIFKVDLRGGKVYHGIDLTYDSPSDFGWLFTTDKLPMDIGYKLFKAYWENRLSVAAKLYPQHGWWTLRTMVETGGIPLHSGLVKFLMEQNVTVPANLIPPEYKS
jgi:TRAP transporter TAXI family solute receptor